MRLTITKAGSSPTKKDGTPLKDKKGNSYFLSWVKTQEHGDNFLHGFTYQDVSNWIGKTIDLEIFEEEYQGRKQLKFRVPRAWKLTQDMWEMLLERVKSLETDVSALRGTNDQEGEINPEDMPF